MNRLAYLLASLSLTVASASADVINRTDGGWIGDVKIVQETIQEILYEQGGEDVSIASEEVLSVAYEKLPRALDEARAALDEDDLIGALELFDEYVDGQLPRPRARDKWAPAFAAWRVMELRAEIGDKSGMITAAGRLIDNFTESRYLPLAYLAKARMELQVGGREDALNTIAGLEQVIATRGLSRRWTLECEVVKVRADTRTENAKRTALRQVAEDAGTKFPTVKNRALVAVGETFLAQADATKDPAEAKEFRTEAMEVFRSVSLDARADRGTLAGAHTGLGECLFFKGADASSPDEAALRAAVLEFLRVPVAYRVESRYVPKALFYAMRCFDLMGDRRRKQDMLTELRQSYPDSPWVAEAAKFDR